MKKFLVLLAVIFLVPYGAFAFTTIDDPNDDAIGWQFETDRMEVSNPYADPFTIEIFTVYPETGVTVGDWVTEPADIFITETFEGNDYLWAIPLVDRGSFVAGGFYAVDSFYTSNYFEPTTGGTYTYNEDAPVWINTQGSNYGFGNFMGDNPWNYSATPTVTWGAGSVLVDLGGVYMDYRTTGLDIYWATATCANDIIEGSVPEPATMFLLGTGLLGLAVIGRKKFFK